MSEEQAGPKIEIDSDWKDEARREKERLAAQEANEPRKGTFPDPTFLEIVNMIAMQAAVSLEGYQHPTGEKIPPDPPMAKHMIDLLEVLSDKTKGNLATEEKQALDGVLYEMRMRYVQSAGAPAASPGPAAAVDRPTN